MYGLWCKCGKVLVLEYWWGLFECIGIEFDKINGICLWYFRYGFYVCVSEWIFCGKKYCFCVCGVKFLMFYWEIFLFMWLNVDV